MNEQHIRRTVVVGVDGSDSALQAVSWGAAAAARRRVPLRLVIGFAWPAGTSEEHPHHGRAYRELLLGQARRHLATAVVGRNPTCRSSSGSSSARRSRYRVRRHGGLSSS